MEMSSNQITSNSKALTTFITVDSNSFKEVVQRLTGLASETATITNSVQDQVTASDKGEIRAKKPVYKLHERRQYKGNLEIIKPAYNFRQGTQFWQPRRLISPAVTPTRGISSLSIGDRLVELNTEEEDRAIRDRRFYLHPSPRLKLGFNEPELLTLFPLTSPGLASDNSDDRDREMSHISDQN